MVAVSDRSFSHRGEQIGEKNGSRLINKNVSYCRIML